MIFLPFLHFFSLLVFIFLAVIILIKNPKSALNRTCALLCFCFGVWSLGKIAVDNIYVSENTAQLFENISSLGWISFSIFFILFVLILTGKNKILKSKLFYLFICIPVLLFDYRQWANGLLLHIKLPYWRGNLWVESIWPCLFFIYYGSVGILSFYLLFDARLKIKNVIKKKQLSVISITAAISYLFATFLDVILPILRIYTIPNLGDFCALVWAFGLTYAIIRYKFLTISPATAAGNIISIMNDGLILLDKNSNIININKKVSGLLGYEEADLTGKPFCDYFCAENSKEVVLDKFAKGEPIKIYDFVLQTRSKQDISTIFASSALRDDSGNIIGTVCLITDISERRKIEDALRQSESELEVQVHKLDLSLKEAEKTRQVMISMLEDNNLAREELMKKFVELKQAQDMLTQSEKLSAIGKLTSAMAHEVNNPLMIISGRAQLSLMETLENKEVKENLKSIMEQCERAKDIMQRLLKFSKPSKGEVKEVNINDSLEDMVKLVEHQYSLRNVKIVKNYAPSLPRIKIDEKQMQEVFMNLLSNSSDAMPQGGTITISTLKEGDYVRIDFKDTGYGMSEENAKRLFEPFFTTKEKGTGLGLAICYGIIKAHGGEIKFESKLGVGTGVTLLLPVGGGLKTKGQGGLS